MIPLYPEILAQCIQGANQKETLMNGLSLALVSSVFCTVINSEAFIKALAGIDLLLPNLCCFKERWIAMRSLCLKKVETVAYMPLVTESDICYGEAYSICPSIRYLGHVAVVSSLFEPDKKIFSPVEFIILKYFPYGNDFLEVSMSDKCSLRLSRLHVENDKILRKEIITKVFEGLFCNQVKVSMFFHEERFFLRSDENQIFCYDLILNKTEMLMTLPKSPCYGTFEGQFYADVHKVHYVFTRTPMNEKPETNLATFTFSKI